MAAFQCCNARDYRGIGVTPTWLQDGRRYQLIANPEQVPVCQCRRDRNRDDSCYSSIHTLYNNETHRPVAVVHNCWALIGALISSPRRKGGRFPWRHRLPASLNHLSGTRYGVTPPKKSAKRKCQSDKAICGTMPALADLYSQQRKTPIIFDLSQCLYKQLMTVFN